MENAFWRKEIEEAGKNGRKKLSRNVFSAVETQTGSKAQIGAVFPPIGKRLAFEAPMPVRH